MADGMDEESAHAARMDEWIAWEARDGIAPQGRRLNYRVAVFLFLF